MSDIHTLALRQPDQARTDCALIESDIEVIQKQLARLPTRPSRKTASMKKPVSPALRSAASVVETEFSASLQTAIARINTSLQDKDIMADYVTAVTAKLRGEL